MLKGTRLRAEKEGGNTTTITTLSLIKQTTTTLSGVYVEGEPTPG